MNVPVKYAKEALQQLWVLTIFVILDAAGSLWLTKNWFEDGTPLRIYVALVVFFMGLITGGVSYGIFLLRRENFRFKQCAGEFHQISHLYRDALVKLFPRVDENADADEFIWDEQKTLVDVCIKIANVFYYLTGRKCVVSVKLLASEKIGNETKRFCFTWARSDHDIYRVEPEGGKYWVGTGENSFLDQALVVQADGASFFHGANLKSLPGYRNQRVSWHRSYMSAIVVPIRYWAKDEYRIADDVLGFLCVDTHSTNRLNATYHIEFLTAFADQMYSFLSVMRYRNTSQKPPFVAEESAGEKENG